MHSKRKMPKMVVAGLLAATAVVGTGAAASAAVYPAGRALHQPQKPPVVTTVVARGSSWT